MSPDWARTWSLHLTDIGGRHHLFKMSIRCIESEGSLSLCVEPVVLLVIEVDTL